MGEEQSRRGKYVYLFLACIIITFSGCIRFYEGLAAKPDFEQAGDFARQGDYAAAAVKYEQIIARYPWVGDDVLFQLGMIYASPRNQHKDYRKSLEYFQRLVKNYPQSKYRQDSEALISLVNDIYNKDKQLNVHRKQVEKLEQLLEISEKKLELMKEVDINLKQKRKTNR